MFFQNWGNPDYWLGILYSLPAVLLALSIHECAHAYAAYKCGDPTARNLGRLTMDPTKHLDLWGTLCLIFFRFGWAKPVPINPRNFKHAKRDNVIVSLSGIISNFILSFIAAAIYFASAAGGITNEIYYNILAPIITLNITLGFFNLLPIPPLDGFQVLATFLPPKAQPVVGFLRRYGFIILIILIVTSVTTYILSGFTGIMMSLYRAFFGLFDPVLAGVIF